MFPHKEICPMAAVSPLAPASFPALTPIAGVRLAAYAAGVRYSGRNDLMLAELAPGSTVAGVLTQSTMPGQPVIWCRECLPRGKVRAIVVNSGNANVFTGRAGRQVVESTAAAAAQAVRLRRSEVFISSTGVIGEPPPADQISRALPEIVGRCSAEAWEAAARAIMTTDTFPKGATATADDRRHAGDASTASAKGSGMIAPDMATMLAFVFTDAALPAAGAADAAGRGGRRRSFNCDHGRRRHLDQRHAAAVRHAAGRARRRSPTPTTRGWPTSAARSTTVMVDLAQQIVARRRGRAEVHHDRGHRRRERRARRGRSACRSAIRRWSRPRSPARTPIGAASSWRSARPARRPTATACRSRSAASGSPATAAPVPGYDEAPVAEHMKGREIVIGVDLGIGRGSATVWTCDLTHGYIDINGSYRS